MTARDIFRKFKLIYVLGRLARRFTPEFITDRLLASRYVFPETRFYETTNDIYLESIRKVGAQRLFPNRDALTILEAGTGIYNPFSAPLLLAGVQRLILLEPFAEQIDYALLQRRFELLLGAAENDPHFPLPHVKRPDEILLGQSDARSLPTGVELVQRLWEDTGLPDCSVDCVMSIAVLEHVRNPEQVFEESFRILRPGGWMINMIDMRDHFFQYPLEMYKYSPRAWRLFATRSGGAGYLNRNTFFHWKQIHKAAGFKIEATIANKFFDEDDFLKERPYFADEFADIPAEDLKIATATYAAQKPLSDRLS